MAALRTLSLTVSETFSPELIYVKSPEISLWRSSRSVALHRFRIQLGRDIFDLSTSTSYVRARSDRGRIVDGFITTT